MQKSKFSISRRLQSFKYAVNGLKVLICEEHNARIHVVIATVVIIISVLFELNIYEWIAVLFCIGFVMVAEIINSSIENLSDFVSVERHDKIKKVKDLAAAAVLVSALMAFLVGLLIFVPKIFRIL